LPLGSLPQVCAGQGDSVEVELDGGAGNGKLAETGQHVADPAGLDVEGGPLLP
jgi:hypothetical protein